MEKTIINTCLNIINELKKINSYIIEFCILCSRRLMVSPFYLLLLMNHDFFFQNEAMLAFGFWFEGVRVLQRLFAVRLTVFPPSLCLLIPNRDRLLLKKKLRALWYNKVLNHALTKACEELHTVINIIRYRSVFCLQFILGTYVS